MRWQLTPYAIPSLVAALASLAMVPFAWRRRHAPGAKAFVALCLSAAWWSAFQTLGVSASELASKLALAKAQWLGIAAAPLAWLAFALSFGGRGAWLSAPRFALLGVVPAVSVGLALSNGSHGLMWKSVGLAEGAPFVALALVRGPWFAVQFVYSYLLVAASTLIILGALGDSPRYRREAAAVAAAPLLVAGANLLYFSPMNPVPFLDLTPLGIALGALVLGPALFRHRLLDLVPVARVRIVEGMSEGVLVLDPEGRVLDLNPAAEGMLGMPASRILGAAITDSVPALASLVARESRQPEPLSLDPGGAGRAYEVTVTALATGEQAGRLVVLRDTTERRRAEEALRQAQAELQRANEELRRLADTDPLTGLGSRRHFFERLAGEIARARRHRQPLAVVMIDLDDFKRVNDTHGHVVGDRVLAAVARGIEAAKRESDVVGRLGGEEFALILPSTDAEGGRELAERVRERLRSERHRPPEGEAFSVTASLGVAELCEAVRDGDALLGLADGALYRAKAMGRDRTCMARPPQG